MQGIYDNTVVAERTGNRGEIQSDSPEQCNKGIKLSHDATRDTG